MSFEALTVAHIRNTMPTGRWGGKLRESTPIDVPEQQNGVAAGRAAALDLNH